MTSSDTYVNLIVNKLTRAQYNTLSSQNKLVSTQLYDITDNLNYYYLKTETSSAAQISTALANIGGNEGGTTTYIDGVSSDLSVNYVSEAGMAKVLEAGDIPSNAIYIVSSDTFNMFGQRVTNVGTPTSSTDAATKGYIDKLLAGKSYDLSQNGKFTQLVVDIGKALGATITNYTASDGESNTYGS